MSTFVMGGIGPLDVSSGRYLLLLLLGLFFVVCVYAVAEFLKKRNSNQAMDGLDTEGKYPVGAEATLPDFLCLRVVEARESRK